MKSPIQVKRNKIFNPEIDFLVDKNELGLRISDRFLFGDVIDV